MRRALVIAAVLACARVAHADATADLIGRTLSALEAGTDCDAKAATWAWCTAAGGWADANMAPLPKAKTLVGITVTLVDGGVVSTELKDQSSLSALVIGGDAKAPTITLVPIQIKDETDHARALGAINMALRGKAKVAKIPGGLAKITASLGGAQSYPLVRGSGGQGWSWSGASAGQLRKVGSIWIAVEPMSSGAYVTILTDKAQ